jgi:hypothetical protein
MTQLILPLVREVGDERRKRKWGITDLCSHCSRGIVRDWREGEDNYGHVYNEKKEDEEEDEEEEAGENGMGMGMGREGGR